MAGLDNERLRLVFQSRPDILAGIEKAADTPDRISLFNNIAAFVRDKLVGDNSTQDGPATKRRRVDVGNANGHTNGDSSTGATSGDSASAAAEAEQVLLEIKDISVSIPQRKKFDLCMTKNYLYARVSGASAPAQGIVYAWKDIEYAFYLPVPEKTQLQYNYLLFPRDTALASLKAAGTTPAVEPLVFTVPATAPKAGSVGGPGATTAASVSDTYSSLFNWAITNQMRSVGNRTPVVASDPKVFHSMMRQSHRPKEQAVHVKAFRGSKDGYLFFLPAGILWAFKKPLLFIPVDRVVAVSYTSVLQRTFNMVVEVDLGDEQTEEIEFSMIDQEDYGVIDERYVKRHALQDRSLADKRKAKRELAENAKDGKKKGEEGADGEEGGEPDDGLTELQRAEQALQDEEDEDEEDYDPGSESDGGSGSSSDEDDDDDDGEGGEDEMDEDEEGDE